MSDSKKADAAPTSGAAPSTVASGTAGKKGAAVVPQLSQQQQIIRRQNPRGNKRAAPADSKRVSHARLVRLLIVD